MGSWSVFFQGCLGRLAGPGIGMAPVVLGSTLLGSPWWDR